MKAGFVLGGKEFLEEVRKRINGDAREQPGLEIIRKPIRFLLLARRNTMMTNRELAERTGKLYDSAVAQAVRRDDQAYFCALARWASIGKVRAPAAT